MIKKLYIILVAIIILTSSCLYAKETQPGSYVPTDVYFTRSLGVPNIQLVMKYNNAKDQIDIAIYSLTEPTIVKAIGDAHKRGVKVRVITDKVQSAGSTQKHAINDLLINGIPVKEDSHDGIMHLKMSIIDGECVALGSYNYTTNASTRNDEILIFNYEADVVRRCQLEFERMWLSTSYSYITEFK